jgi:hypothetical protein
VLFVAALLVVVPSSLGLVRSVTLCPLMVFVIKVFLSLFVSSLCCLIASEHGSGCFRSIQVLWRRTIMYHVNLMDVEFFLNCAICITLLMVWCEQTSLGSARCTIPLLTVALPVISAVSIMAENEPLCFYATFSGLDGPCFYCCKSI